MKALIISVILCLFAGFVLAEETVISISTNTEIINLNHRKISTLKTNDTIFQYFGLKNISQQSIDIILEFPSETIEFIKVDMQSGLHSETEFFDINSSVKKFYDKDIVYEYSIAPNQIMHFKVQSVHSNKTDKNEIFFWNKFTRINGHHFIDFSRGFFYGFLILFILMGLILYFLIREINYLRFFYYLLFGTLYLAVKHNIAYEFLWPNYPKIDVFVRKFILLLYILSALNFFKSFIQKRIKVLFIYKYINYTIYLGLLTLAVSVIAGLFSENVLNVIYKFQYFYILLCILLILFLIVLGYLRLNDTILFSFLLTFFLSFAFFLFYPVSTFSRFIENVNFGLIYTYSNAFIIAILISGTILWRIHEIMKNNDLMRKEVSNLNAQQNFAAITAQLNERKRVGKELHDGIGIVMATTKMRLSSIKATDETDKVKLAEIIADLDNTTQKIRKFSHNLLPPTLLKFGMYVAITDEIEHYNSNKKSTLNFNVNDYENLDEVSQYIIYNICINFIKYFYKTSNYKVSIQITTDEEKKRCSMIVAYSGNSLNMESNYIKNIHDIIELLQGSIKEELINTYNYKVLIDVPIRFKDV